MEHQKILNLLNQPSDSKSVSRMWNIVNDQSNANYDVGNEIIYNTEKLMSILWDYSDAYILVKGDIIITAHNKPTPIAFKNFAPFFRCVTKMYGTTINDNI